VSREEFVGLQLKEMAASHFSGSFVPMLMSLVSQAKLSKADRAAIEKLIANIRE
jgi:predicted transcriptional regulator